MHHIQKHILAILTYSKTARFAELRPDNTDSNLFSYHLKALLKANLVEKSAGGYTLTHKGLAFVDRLSKANFEPRLQPKIITMIIAFNDHGEVLIQKRKKQPFINSWTLPSGKLHLEDESIMQAAKREMKEKTGLELSKLNHAGDVYIKVISNKEIISSVLAHLFVTKISSAPELKSGLRWQKVKDLNDIMLAPAIKEITASVSGGKKLVFKELKIDYSG